MNVGYKIVNQVGGAERLSEHSWPVAGVIITAKYSNVGVVFFSLGPGANPLEGTEAGIERYAGERLELRNGVDLKDVWVAVAESGDGVYWFSWT